MLQCVCSRLVKSVKDVYLQQVFEAMIIVANHRHICWVREHNGQSKMFKNLLNSAKKNASGKCWLCHIIKISVPTSLQSDIANYWPGMHNTAF